MRALLWAVIALAACGPAELRFLEVNDLHLLDEASAAYPERVIAAMNAEEADLVLVCGDVATDGKESELLIARRVLEGLRIPYRIVIGNHDALHGGDAEEEVFKRVFGQAETTYAFVHKGVHFVAVDPGCGHAYLKNAVRPPVMERLRELAAAIPEGAPVVLFSHYPFGPGVTYRVPNAEEVLALFAGRRVLAAVSGHWHGNTERRDRGVLFTTTACASGTRGNHDRTPAKGYRRFVVRDGAVETEFRPVPPSDPVRVIFDTDMDSDCDDVGALALLHALADLGEAEILATISSSKNPDTPKCIDAINTFYGRPDLPVGAPQGPGAGRASKYARGVAERFPYDLGTVPDAARLYRELLLRQPDRSVVIVTVGYLTNIADLLRLPAEGALPSGRETVERKVRLWACMGGNFVGKPAKDDVSLTNNNFTVEKAGALHAVRDWPAPLMFVGREIGSVPSGLKAGARLRELPERHPVRLAYALYFGGEPKDRHVADQTAVLFAVRGLRDVWSAETRGAMDLKPDMTFEWTYDRDSEQGYLLKKGGPAADRKVEREIEDLMMRPPRR